MGMGYKRTLTTSDVPVWQRIDQNAQGGFLLDTTDLVTDSVVKAGTPMAYNEATRTAKPLLTATFYETSTGTPTTYKVNKGHNLVVGKYFARTAGDKAYAITAIDTSNAAYDVVTVGTSIGGATIGETAFASSTTGASNSSYGGVNGCLHSDVVVKAGESCSVVIRGTLYARRVPYSSALDAALKANGAFIIYSQSY